MSEQGDAGTWHCATCNEDHPLIPKVTACWVRDGRRLAALESAVQRIEARAEVERAQMLDPHHGHGPQCHCPGCLLAAVRQAEARGRHAPPGVFPPMGKADFGARADGMTLAEHHERTHGHPHPLPGMLSQDARVPVVMRSRDEVAAIFERGGYVPRTDDVMHCCGSPSPLHRAGCRVVKGLEGMVTKPPTPAAMLGEAAELLKRAMDAMQAAGIFDGGGVALVKVQAARDVVVLAKHNAEARLANCPRGIHGGPGCDACDCAAIATAGKEER